jgi:catechol 2,3-dioxygenase-like lactoylglutathione lyase family enzyme
MLGQTDILASLAVKDLKIASRFYEDILGLKRTGGEGDETIIYTSGKSRVFVYRSQYAGTNKATAAYWVVNDVDAVVKGLKAKGVKFEHYDLPGLRLEGDVHIGGKVRTAWFKDPDGNILSIVNQ